MSNNVEELGKMITECFENQSKLQEELDVLRQTNQEYLREITILSENLDKKEKLIEGWNEYKNKVEIEWSKMTNENKRMRQLLDEQAANSTHASSLQACQYKPLGMSHSDVGRCGNNSSFFCDPCQKHVCSHHKYRQKFKFKKNPSAETKLLDVCNNCGDELKSRGDEHVNIMRNEHNDFNATMRNAQTAKDFSNPEVNSLMREQLIELMGDKLNKTQQDILRDKWKALKLEFSMKPVPQRRGGKKSRRNKIKRKNIIKSKKVNK